MTESVSKKSLADADGADHDDVLTGADEAERDELVEQLLIELAAPPRAPEPPAQVIPLSRYMRPAEQYALPGLEPNPNQDEEDNK